MPINLSNIRKLPNVFIRHVVEPNRRLIRIEFKDKPTDDILRELLEFGNLDGYSVRSPDDLLIQIDCPMDIETGDVGKEIYRFMKEDYGQIYEVRLGAPPGPYVEEKYTRRIF